MSAATTIAVVAVFEISMEETIVTVIMPNRIDLGLLPHIFNVPLIRTSSSFTLVMAEARKKPPSINQITLLENVFT